MRIAVSLGVSVAVCSLVVPAMADNKPVDSGSSFTLSRETSASAPAMRGRSLAAQGKCEAALDAFDEALRHSYDPAIFRDRAACHDRLDHLYPAIDDYREYLTAMPTAPDADKVRARLDELEGKVPAEDRKLGRGGNYELEMRGGTGVVDRVSAQKGSDDDSKVVEGDNRPLREIETTEQHERETRTSPLRRGTGPVVGFLVMPRVWTTKTFNISQSYGVAMRYSFGPLSSVISELAYINSTSGGTASQLGGLGLFLGYEARVSLDQWAANHLVFGGGLGYENQKQGATGFVYSTFAPRARLGWRHTFGRAIGVEVMGDAGVGFTHALGSTLSDEVSGVFGLNAAFLVGF